MHHVGAQGLGNLLSSLRFKPASELTERDKSGLVWVEQQTNFQHNPRVTTRAVMVRFLPEPLLQGLDNPAPPTKLQDVKEAVTDAVDYRR